MNKFKQEIVLILTISVGIPTGLLICLAGAWWKFDSRAVMTVYLLAILVLFVLCVTASLRDEMKRKEEHHGRR